MENELIYLALSHSEVFNFRLSILNIFEKKYQEHNSLLHIQILMNELRIAGFSQ